MASPKILEEGVSGVGWERAGGKGEVHPGVARRGLVDVWLVDYEEDLCLILASRAFNQESGPVSERSLDFEGSLNRKALLLTFFGLLRVTLVIPGTCFRPNLAMDFLAFFSLRECTVTLDPAGTPDSPSPPASASESELLEASSTSAPFLVGGSSGSSSMRGFDILEQICCS